MTDSTHLSQNPKHDDDPEGHGIHTHSRARTETEAETESRFTEYALYVMDAGWIYARLRVASWTLGGSMIGFG